MYLTIDSMTFLPSNLFMTSLSGIGSTEHDWMTNNNIVKGKYYYLVPGLATLGSLYVNGV